MQTNQAPLDNAIGSHTSDYVEAIGVPDFNLSAVRARRVSPIRSNGRRQGAIAAAAAVIVVAFILNGPAVLAQVQRTLHAFVNLNGQNVAVPVQSLTLEEARARVPFTVIAPAAIPAGYQGTIDEIDPGPSRFQSRLVFRFSNGTGPGITIMEGSATQANRNERLLMTVGKGGGSLPHAAALPAPATGRHAFVEFHRDGVTRRIAAEPISWTVGGTRIDLISPPGLLSKAQMDAIRRAMH